jgi:NitT/TauT family transport system ATP-binding protein
LFPWLTVAGNIELALRLRGVGKAERRARAQELLVTVHLDGFGQKRPHELSGGMRHRVALARAFAQDADVLLMDEPFGALDAMTRDILHAELERLWVDRGLTIVFVTHNVREAARLADRVIALSSRPGRVIETFDVDIERPRRIEFTRRLRPRRMADVLRALERLHVLDVNAVDHVLDVNAVDDHLSHVWDALGHAGIAAAEAITTASLAS